MRFQEQNLSHSLEPTSWPPPPLSCVHWHQIIPSFQNSDATPITTRQLESMIRLTEARAKLQLREVATRQAATFKFFGKIFKIPKDVRPQIFWGLCSFSPPKQRLRQLGNCSTPTLAILKFLRKPNLIIRSLRLCFPCSLSTTANSC